jgi:hypothetical protein
VPVEIFRVLMSGTKMLFSDALMIGGMISTSSASGSSV